MTTVKLGVPIVAADAAQKHAQVNEALGRFDQLVQQTVINRTTTAPPASPGDGHAYIIAAPATGEWAGREGQIAASIYGAWIYFTPREGWIVFDEAVGIHVKWTGSAWVLLGASSSDTWGWQNFQHAGSAVSLTSAGTWYPLINDGAGALTDSSTYAVSGHGAIWDSVTNRMDLSSLSVGDRVHCRIDMTFTTGSNNTSLSGRLVLQEGVLDVPVSFGAPSYYKASGAQDSVVYEPSFTIFNTGTRDNPVRLEVKSDTASASVAIAGFTFETRVR